MWVARNKYGGLCLFELKPYRCDKVGGNYPNDEILSISPCVWRIKNPYGGFYDTFGYIKIDEKMFPNLTWEDEPIEVVITEKPNLSLDVIREETPDDTIVLTRYYEDYEKEHKWFVNMLKHQERYKDCTDEEVEEIWKNHIKEEYTFDEIWNTIQCDGYTKIVLRMGRHDIQPTYDYVLETKEYIDEKMKNYG